MSCAGGVSARSHELLRQAGADIAWGRNAYAALAETGYVDLDVRGYSEVWHGGSIGAHLHRANAQQTAARLVQQALATETELADFHQLIEDPHFAVSSYLMLSTTGRRPGHENDLTRGSLTKCPSWDYLHHKNGCS